MGARASGEGGVLVTGAASISGSGAMVMGGHADLTLPAAHLVATPTGQAIGRITLARAELLATSGALAPSVAIASLDTPFPTIAGHGYQESFGEADLVSPARLLASPYGAVGKVTVSPARVFAVEAVTIERQAVLVLPLAIGATVGLPRRSYTSGFMLGAAIDAQQIMVRQELLALAGISSHGLLVALERLQERMDFADIAGVVWNLLHQEGLGFGDTAAPSVGMLVEAGEALALLAGGVSALDGLAAVVAALQLGAAAGYVWPSTILEAIALAGGGVDALLALEHPREHLGIAATATAAVTFTWLVPEGLTLGDAASATAELLERIVEGAVLLASIRLPDGQFLAWVCNTESRAFTTYRNFPFNSFCELDGHYYGATDEGIYLLEGDDDAGVPIDAHVRGGLMDMGTGKLKRQEAMYLGYRATGQLLLKVVTTSDGGEKAEAWYSLAEQPADAIREGRIKIGKGLKSVYWGFEVANVDGADFELDTIAWLPMVLERRI